MNNKNVKIVDEHGIDRSANVMFAFDLEGSEYVTYWIERDEENNNIFVSKVIKNLDGTFNMVNIDDSMEKSRLSDIVKTLITASVSSEADKLDGTSVTLADGKVVKFMNVSFNKEQSINVQKTYITTVKKEVTRVAEKYYAVEVSLNDENVGLNIFPTVTPVVETVKEDVVPEINIPNEVQPSVLEVETPVITPVVSEPGLPTSTVQTSNDVHSNDFVTFGTEATIPEPEVTPQVIPGVMPVVSEMSVEPKEEPIPTVVESITVAEPTVNVANPVPAEVLPVANPTPVVEPEVIPSVNVEQSNDVSQPLVFNAAKETNLNAALGEAANSTSIPVDNIQPVREFGVDEVVKTPENVTPVVTPVQPDVVTGQKAGFANSKFFMVVAVAFFLASCIFLGYEVFNYFQLTK